MAIHAPKEVIDRINSGEADERAEREPLDEGDYLCRVKGVEYREPKTEDGFGYVRITWEVVRPRAHKGHWLWDNLSFAPRAAWKVKAFWDALGYEYDSDFEELPDDPEAQAVLEVSQRIIEVGKSKGKIGNEVGDVLEPTADALAMIPE